MLARFGAALSRAFFCAGTLALAFRHAAHRWISPACRLCTVALAGLGLASLHACLALLQALLLRRAPAGTAKLSAS